MRQRQHVPQWCGPRALAGVRALRQAPGPWPGSNSNFNIKEGLSIFYLFIFTEHSCTSWEVGWKLNEICDTDAPKSCRSNCNLERKPASMLAAAVFNFSVQRDRQIGLECLTLLLLGETDVATPGAAFATFGADRESWSYLKQHSALWLLVLMHAFLRKY